VASSSRLADVLAASFPDGTLIFVRSVRDWFRLQRPSALPVDNITIVNALDGGQWLREYIADESWLYQNTWFIDPALGNDENGGTTALTALETHTELERRWGSGLEKTLPQNTTVSVLGDLAEVVTIAVSPRTSVTLTYVGTATVVASGTLTAATATAPATNIQQSVTDGAAPGWAAHVGRRIVLGNGAYTGIADEISASEARTGTFIIPDANFANGSAYTPAGNETYQVQTLSRLMQGIELRGISEGSIVLRDLRLDDFVLDPTRAGLFIDGCIFFGDHVVTGGENELFISCIFVGSLRLLAGTASFIGGVVIGELHSDVGSQLNLQAPTAGTPHLLVQGMWVHYTGSRTIGSNLRGIGVFDSPSDGAVFEPGATCADLGVLYGSGHAGHGARIERGGEIIYTAVGNRPTITGALGDLTMASTTYVWNGDVPTGLAWGGPMMRTGGFGTNPGERAQRGTATLVNGVVVVGGAGTRIFLVNLVSRIFLTPRGNNGGVAIGEPTVISQVNGSPGTASFTVNSLSFVPAVVATDQRSFDWEIQD
jgi:hypothetical protein